ncbi:MAG: hypothetical protein ACYDCK_11340 [Thermoplasmatota archaeon]
MASLAIWLIFLSLLTTGTAAVVAAHQHGTGQTPLDLASEYRRIADRVIHDAEHVASLEEDHAKDVREIRLVATFMPAKSGNASAVLATITGLDNASRAVRFDGSARYLIYRNACPMNLDPGAADVDVTWPVITEMFRGATNSTEANLALYGVSPAPTYCVALALTMSETGARFEATTRVTAS